MSDTYEKCRKYLELLRPVSKYQHLLELPVELLDILIEIEQEKVDAMSNESMFACSGHASDILELLQNARLRRPLEYLYDRYVYMDYQTGDLQYNKLSDILNTLNAAKAA